MAVYIEISDSVTSENTTPNSIKDSVDYREIVQISMN